ncbi:biotin--[acetyl-CoA-carboxylase] ligase [bacterium]|nr:biotin--[acetyl-CoA-carboxylase] ligase [bacterium]
MDVAPIVGDELRKQLRCKLIGREIYAFKQISSTNNFAKRLAQNGRAEGIIVLSDSQTMGRGRLGRSWYAPPGLALSFSLVLRPATALDRLGLIGLLCGVTLVQTLERLSNLTAELKWPNDVLINGKKVCGILVESEASEQKSKYALLGIGINVNQSGNDFSKEIRQTATSLLLETKRSWNRIELLMHFLQTFEENYIKFKNGDQSFVCREWSARSPHLHSMLKLRVGLEEVEGEFERVDEFGRMVLRTQDGLRVIHSGEIT